MPTSVKAATQKRRPDGHKVLSAFANLSSTYTKAFNRAYERTGSLFEKPFRRKLVESNRYFTCLAAYIHRNPQRHGFVDDFRH